LDQTRSMTESNGNANQKIIGLGKQDFGGPIPEGYHHRGELHFRSVGLGQAEVSDLEVALRGDQQVLGLQVPMDDAMRVQKVHASKQFPWEALKWKWIWGSVKDFGPSGISGPTWIVEGDMPDLGSLSMRSERSCSRCSKTRRISSWPSRSRNWHTSNSLQV